MFVNNLKFKLHRFRSIGKHYDIGRNVSVLNSEYISLGDYFCVGNNCLIQAWPAYRNKATGFKPDLTIGNNVSMMSNCLISCVNKVTIGDGCLLGDNVFITDNYHGNGTESQRNIIPIERPLFSKGPVSIGKNVWIGRNVCIMPGVMIGDCSIIGANSVVTKDVSSNTMVAGCPAKEIKIIN